MLVDMNNLVSITEVNRNFSKIARMVDENGSVVILKNNVPEGWKEVRDQAALESALNTSFQTFEENDLYP